MATSALARGRLLLRGATLGDVLGRAAAVHGGRRLVSEAGGRTLTHREGAALVERWARRIAVQAAPGDRVVVALPNGYDAFLACLAAARAGALPVPVNPQMRDEEVDHVVADAGASLVLRTADDLAGPDVGPPLPAHRPAPGDVAALFYTSGTTDKPKGAELTHRALVGQLRLGALLPDVLRRDEAVVALPVAHIMGFLTLLGLAVAGIPAYVLPRFRPTDVLDALEGRRSTMFVGVPAMYRMLLDAGADERDLTSVRWWASGADAMPDDLARRFQRFGATASLPLFGPVGQAGFLEGYGMVELGGAAAIRVSPPGVGPVAGRLPDVLAPLPGIALRVVGEDGRDVRGGGVGELWVRGPGVLRGYHGRPEATAEVVVDGGWLRTGDLARRGPLGTIRLAGRSKDVVKHGGYSVYARDVEGVLEQHPAVAEAAVVGLPDPVKGEVPAAAVRLRPGAGPVDPAALIAHCAEHLADYKVPVQLVVVPELPRTGTTKVQKRQLLPLFEAR